MLVLPILIFLIGLAVCNWASGRYSAMMEEALRESTPTAHTGSEIAQLFLNYQGLANSEIVEHDGVISNYYDPDRKRLFLSHSVAQGKQMAHWAIALHEAAHATEEGEGLKELKWRQTIIKLSRYAPTLSLGMLLAAMVLLRFPARFAILGLLAICLAILLLNLGTLSVEFRANAHLSDFLDRHLARHPSARDRLEYCMNRVATREVADLMASPKYFFLSAIPGTGAARAARNKSNPN
jgi:Zn-dependent membrane protease YugP